MFNDFYLSRYTFILEARERLILPLYKGSTFRGGFGHAFKKVTCTVRNRPCEECLLKNGCVYFYVFETHSPEGSTILKKYKSVPHPFIIEPPLEQKTEYLPGDELRFSLVLIGRAGDYLPYFIYTFEELGQMGIGKGRGKYDLKQVNVAAPHGEEILYSSTDKKLKNYKSAISGLNIQTAETKESITMRLVTPMRLMAEGSLVADMKFHHLVRNLLRRASTLSYFHCGKRLEADFKEMISRAEKIETTSVSLEWYDWERYSQRQNTKMKLGGLVGSITFKGQLSEFMPLLRFGELVHAGKGTSFGLGKYELHKSKVIA